jgi:hypothetical protein
MKAIKFFILFVALNLTLMNSTAIAQISKEKHDVYSTAAGLRLSYLPGISLKHFVTDNAAIEGILGIRFPGFLATGLYEGHTQFFDVPRMHWVYGFGGHIGSYKEVKYYSVDEGKIVTYKGNSLAVGVDAIGGVEYMFMDIPFTMGVDLKPSYDFPTTCFKVLRCLIWLTVWIACYAYGLIE